MFGCLPSCTVIELGVVFVCSHRLLGRPGWKLEGGYPQIEDLTRNSEL